MHSQLRRVASAIAMFLSALALQWAATTPWAEGSATDGTRYRVSPIGIAHVVTPTVPNAKTIDCRWWPKVGTPSLCAVADGGERAYRRLRLAYPGLQVALWLSVAALFLQALRIPRSAGAHVAIACVLLVLIASVVVVVRTAPSAALSVLQGVTLAYHSLGYVLASGAAALALLSIILLAERGATSRVASDAS